LIGGNNFDVFTGDDVMEGGEGADHFQGGPRRTDLIYSHSKQGVYVDLELNLGFGGEAQGDTFDGIRGAIYGSKFGDRLVAGQELFGQGGDDQLVAGYGTMQMTGGTGMDSFIFRYSTDYIADLVHITDFDQALHEPLNVRGIDANTKAIGDQAFTFIGTAAFSGAAGELRYSVTEDGHTLVEMNVTKGDDLVDHKFVLDGSFTLTGADFLL
ncbi:MAG TPA: hypothetical protein VHL34_05485, partial [Rhizomicrobium sp.]|nr:hypothetical protein [Rhizomicrobium sp.]